MVSNVIDEPAYRDREFVFKDRLHAGQLLADKLRSLLTDENVQLLAVPSGGVPVGYAVAQKLQIPLDVAVVRKIQIPWNTEAGFGAVSWDGRVFLNDLLVGQLGLNSQTIEQCVSRTREIVRQRVQAFRGTRPPLALGGRVVVLVDDGLASGFTMMAAAESVRRQNPRRIIVAVTTGSANAIEVVAPYVDRLLCLNIRRGLIFAVADAYEVWYDLSDDEVLEFLEESEREATSWRSTPQSTGK